MKLALSVLLIGSLSLAPIEVVQSAPKSSQGARIKTEMDIKRYWLKKFPRPNKLDKDFHKRKKEYQKFMADIKKGKYDYKAKVVCLRWNISEYERVGKHKAAENLMVQLFNAEHEERQRQEAADRARLLQKLDRISFELKNMHIR